MTSQDSPKEKKNKKPKIKKEGTPIPNEEVKENTFKSKYNIDDILKGIEEDAKRKQSLHEQINKSKNSSTENQLKELRHMLVNTIVIQHSLIELLIGKGCVRESELSFLIQRNYELLVKLNNMFGEGSAE